MLNEYDGEDLERNTIAAIQVAAVGETGCIKKGILLKKGMGKMVRPWALRTDRRCAPPLVGPRSRCAGAR